MKIISKITCDGFPDDLTPAQKQGLKEAIMRSLVRRLELRQESDTIEVSLE